MVRWYHAIFSAYEFWLPNDPRGSWSDFVHSWELYRFGVPATTVGERRSYAHDPHDVQFRRQMKAHLKHPPVRFEAAVRKSIALGFESACNEFAFRIHACASGFDHPTAHIPGCPTAWGRKCWSVFIHDEKQLRNAIAYVERRPGKEGLAPQQLDFIVPVE